MAEQLECQTEGAGGESSVVGWVAFAFAVASLPCSACIYVFVEGGPVWLGNGIGVLALVSPTLLALTLIVNCVRRADGRRWCRRHPILCGIGLIIFLWNAFANVAMIFY